MPFSHLKPKINTILANNHNGSDERLKEVCELLQTSIAHYDWVGFYFANEAEKTLHLKAFAGEPTDHTTIPFGRGICGQVAVSNKNFVVPDVKAQDNYIACSITVKSEIVIPLFKDGKNIGQIDIDSHVEDPFSEEDERFLEWVNEEVAKIL
ncbi:GAF domain-containing protein [Aequorivita lipolytica]|uniref:GAF domain-containing protein n=1 Tax=Aequorivita lipolytica TaxID=153267 RepID=A0A5C6YQQ3_9FLAO|nr:GAF domain-containing protein [Aequorivita lipolytica]TXD69773.1 GAF domain-containing protein [Aequorivita lipolytica]SRX50417.1 Free methionine-R-sulfoxide reductase [Aequorivita lipolytica]